MDRRTLLFIAISVMIIVVYQEVVLKRFAPPPEPVPEPASTMQPAPDAQGKPIKEAPLAPPSELEPGEIAEKPPEARLIRVETDLYSADFSTVGGRLQNFALKKFRQENHPDSPPLSLVVPAPELELPLGVELRGSRTWSDTNLVYEPDRDSVELQGEDEGSLVLRATAFSGQTITKRLLFRGNDYPITLEISTPAASEIPHELNEPSPDGQSAAIGLILSRGRELTEGGTTVESAAALVDGKLVQKPFKGLEGTEMIPGPIQWAGFEDHYFLTAAASDGSTALQLRAAGRAVEEKMLVPRAVTGPTEVAFTLYYGPKDQHTLEAAGHGLERALNLGWFAPISLLLLRVLDVSHKVTRNYGLDIIVLTVLVKVAFWPLTRKSFESMRQMQRLQPEMAKIREKFKEDPKQMNTEIMELYKRHKVNPLGGCIPMALQIPVFIGLYSLLQNMIQLRHAHFAFWIHDLAAPERLHILGVGIPVLTILLGISMFVQQRLQPPAGDPTQQRIMMFMPLIFTFMFISFPAGLTIYWLTNNILTIAQQWFMLRNTPT